MKPVALVVLFSFFSCVSGYSQSLIPVETGRSVSIRGVSVLSDQLAWISGSKGSVAKTVDGAKSWTWVNLDKYAALDFRDIEVLSENEALVMSSGSPAIILRTSDGGTRWDEVYRDDRPEIFLDGMDFWDSKNGIIYGDPIKGRMQILRTSDGGKTWQDISVNSPANVIEGEAGFAASGTGIRCMGKSQVVFVTGGVKSRVFSSSDAGASWKSDDLPILQGQPSTGAFSIAFADKDYGVVVGGDYQNDKRNDKSMFYTRDGGKTWHPPVSGTGGYRSSVEFLDRTTLLAAGTSGVDISIDKGLHWRSLSTTGYHVIKKAKQGNLVLLAGSDGRVAVLKH